MWSIIDILHKNFQEDHTNSRRFPGFLGVVDTLYNYCMVYLLLSIITDIKYFNTVGEISCHELQQFIDDDDGERYFQNSDPLWNVKWSDLEHGLINNQIQHVSMMASYWKHIGPLQDTTSAVEHVMVK